MHLSIFFSAVGGGGGLGIQGELDSKNKPRELDRAP